ncbi:MAG: AraC family transcriptional regulator [Pseudomonadales bacterium]|nr:AraC family transcriptional regulator [Pseudomonadales bacterium]
MKAHYTNHTVSIHFARAYLERGRQLGLDCTALMEYAALTPALLEDDRNRLAPYQLARLLHKVMVDGDDEFMGLAAEQARFGIFTLLAERLIHCATLRDALVETRRFYRLVTGSVLFEIHESADVTRLSLRMTQPEKDPEFVMTELLMLIWHRFPSWLIAEVIPLNAVHMVMPEPRHRAEYPLLFPCPAWFNQTENSLLWPTYMMERPIQQTEEQLRRYLAKVPLVWFRKLQFAEQLTERVTHILKHCEDLQRISIEDVAAQLHMTSRTLRRKLTVEGTQFQSLKDNVRRERAIYWLSQNSSIKEAAAKTGYTETASFVRAFKHWTGLSPGQYKRQLLAQ